MLCLKDGYEEYTSILLLFAQGEQMKTLAEIKWKLNSQDAINELSEIKWTVLSNENNITITNYDCEEDAIKEEFIKRCTGYETIIYSPNEIQRKIDYLIRVRKEHEERVKATGGNNRVNLAKVMDNDVLLCGHCDNEYTHLYKVEIFDRKEDSKTGKHLTYTMGEVIPGDCWAMADGKGNLTTDNNLDANPSPRREGIRLTYVCESCGKDTHITFAQHTGMTHTGVL